MKEFTEQTRRQITLEAAWVCLGESHGESLVRFADELLHAAIYSDSLAELADCSDPIMSIAEPLFWRALDELGVPKPTESEATWTLLWHYINRIAEGVCSPRCGLEGIASVYYATICNRESTGMVGCSYGIEHLLGAHFATDDVPAGRLSFKGLVGPAADRALDDDIRSRAKNWLASYPTDWRVWGSDQH